MLFSRCHGAEVLGSEKNLESTLPEALFKHARSYRESSMDVKLKVKEIAETWG